MGGDALEDDDGEKPGTTVQGTVMMLSRAP